MRFISSLQSRWDEATKHTIKTKTKPCPKCRTPTERTGVLIKLKINLS